MRGGYRRGRALKLEDIFRLNPRSREGTDLKYLGYEEADVKLEHGSGSVCMRVVHPGGGSSYAISYTDQKRVEAYREAKSPRLN